MQQRYDVLGFGLICFVGALLVLAGSKDILFTDQSWLFRWQGLIGAILGAIGTIIGGGIAYLAVQHQLSHAAAQTTHSQESAKQAATLALSQPVHAASMVLHLLRRAVNGRDSIGQGNADREVGIAVAQLERTLQHFSLRELVLDLSATDRSLFLMVVLRFESFVNIYRNPGLTLLRAGRLQNQIRDLENTLKYIDLFDRELGRAFARDGGISTVGEAASQ